MVSDTAINTAPKSEAPQTAPVQRRTVHALHDGCHICQLM
jgi:hypothetical protein